MDQLKCLTFWLNFSTPEMFICCQHFKPSKIMCFKLLFKNIYISISSFLMTVRNVKGELPAPSVIGKLHSTALFLEVKSYYPPPKIYLFLSGKHTLKAQLSENIPTVKDGLYYCFPSCALLRLSSTSPTNPLQ